MLTQKSALTWQDIEDQNTLELPDRETPATVVLGCLAVCVGHIRINVSDVNVGAQVCAAVQVLNVTLLSLAGAQLSCDVRQH
jgi:Mg/Co/Ni transporter MgtE